MTYANNNDDINVNININKNIDIEIGIINDINIVNNKTQFNSPLRMRNSELAPS